MCESMGVWGRLPNGFDKWENAKPKVYITSSVNEDQLNGFQFNAKNAKELTFKHEKWMDTCYEVSLCIVKRCVYVCSWAPKYLRARMC